MKAITEIVKNDVEPFKIKEEKPTLGEKTTDTKNKRRLKKTRILTISDRSLSKTVADVFLFDDNLLKSYRSSLGVLGVALWKSLLLFEL